MRPLLLLSIGACLLVGACTTTTEFPSLAPRPVEGVLAKPSVETSPSVSVDPALEATVVSRLATAQDSARAFDAALIAARTAVGRSGAATVGSEAWLDAQQALTALGAARGGASGAVADLEAERLAAGAGERVVDTTRLDAALDTLNALVARQSADYDALAARLPDG